MPAPLLPMRLKPNDPHVLTTAEEALADGLNIPTLATELGVSENTLYNWIEQARNGEIKPELGSTAAFLEAIERGLARFEGANVAVISGARAPKPGGWQPAAWLLERRLPDRWGQRRDINVTAKSQVLVLSAEVTPEVLAESRRRYLAWLTEQQGLLTARTDDN